MRTYWTGYASTPVLSGPKPRTAEGSWILRERQSGHRAPASMDFANERRWGREKGHEEEKEGSQGYVTRGFGGPARVARRALPDCLFCLPVAYEKSVVTVVLHMVDGYP